MTRQMKRTKKRMKKTLSWVLMITLLLGSLAPTGLAQQQDDTKVNTTPPSSTAQGTTKIKPAQGSEGTGATYNFLPYSLPGQYPNPLTQQIENQPFDIAYAARTQPVQTSDWWTGIGLQWSNEQHTVGWVVGRSDAEGKAGRSRSFIAEPFTMSFIDYGDAPANQILGINPLPAGLRLWSPNKLSVQNKGKVTTDANEKFDASNNYGGFGNPAEPSPIVTVGLAGVHPLGTAVRGQNQESVSEAMNFAYGLIELGQIRGDNKLRDLGVYLFAEEELAAQQYWFNSDANLSAPSKQPYNGNWPSSLVHYTGPDGGQWKTTLITNVKQFGIFRSTFFGGIAGAYTIQQTPLAAYLLFFGRNQNWLKETWQQYLLDSGGAPQGPYETIVAAIQAQLPPGGTNLTDVGLTPALKRINATHNFFPGAPNAHAKHWSYSLAALGQIDYSVVADTTSYAVFNNAGQRTYTAYNPSDNDITVTFTDRTSGAKTTFQTRTLCRRPRRRSQIAHRGSSRLTFLTRRNRSRNRPCPNVRRSVSLRRITTCGTSTGCPVGRCSLPAGASALRLAPSTQMRCGWRSTAAHRRRINSTGSSSRRN